MGPRFATESAEAMEGVMLLDGYADKNAMVMAASAGKIGRNCWGPVGIDVVASKTVRRTDIGI